MLHFHDGLVLNGRFYTFYFFPFTGFAQIKVSTDRQKGKNLLRTRKKKDTNKKNGFNRRFRIKLIHIPRQIVLLRLSQFYTSSINELEVILVVEGNCYHFPF